MSVAQKLKISETRTRSHDFDFKKMKCFLLEDGIFLSIKNSSFATLCNILIIVSPPLTKERKKYVCR
jgi:hypothetical protein